MRGRFAPSPTGHLHLGNVRSALLGWLQARAAGGEFWLRIEDLDVERCKPQFIDSIRSDLEFLGLEWQGPMWLQSERRQVYDHAIDQLNHEGLIYPCTCSRADIARAVSAPHVGEEGPVYPRTCAGGAIVEGRPRALRFRVTGGPTAFNDLVMGHFGHDVEQAVGDFIVRRADGIASYQLAVVVDDAAAGVTHVLRGADLLSSTPRQIQLAHALGLPVPTYAHVPLVMENTERRLAKRDGSLTVRALREAGVSAERIIGLLAKWSGLSDGQPVRAAELVSGFSLERLSTVPTVIDLRDLEALKR